MRFTQIHVCSRTLNRYKKKSFYWYKKVIASNGEDLENNIEY